jgi:hypothetical protein
MMAITRSLFLWSGPAASSSRSPRWSIRQVSTLWGKKELRGKAATLERLRIDRQLQEGLDHGPDPLHLAAVFGLDPKTAIRYAESARLLLTTIAEEQDPASSTEPRGLQPP